MTRTELVVSELLSAHPVVPPQVGGPLLRALGLVDREPADEQHAADFAASVAAGYVEPLDDYRARIRRVPADWAEQLRYAAITAHLLLAARVAQLETAVKAVRP